MPQLWQDSTSIHIQLAKSLTYVPFLPYTLNCFSPHFLKGLISNDWYVTACGFSDNNRLKTWMPYVVNRVPLSVFPCLLPFCVFLQTGTGLAHERTGLPLFGPYYAQWYFNSSTLTKYVDFPQGCNIIKKYLSKVPRPHRPRPQPCWCSLLWTCA